MSQEVLEDLAEIRDVGLQVRREDENIIVIHKHKDIKHVPQNIIDQCLKHSKSILKPKGNHKGLVVSTGVFKHCPFIPLANCDKLVSISEVPLGKNFSSLQHFKSS